MPKYRDDGREIRYSITINPIEWYVSNISGFNVTNEYRPETTTVGVRKIWDDNDDELCRRPTSIIMTLNNGLNVVLNEGNAWTAFVTDLPTYINKEPMTYAWQEQSIIGYAISEVRQDGSIMVFTNGLWQRPEIPEGEKPPKTPGDAWYVFEDYDTPL